MVQPLLDFIAASQDRTIDKVRSLARRRALLPWPCACSSCRAAPCCPGPALARQRSAPDPARPPARPPTCSPAPAQLMAAFAEAHPGAKLPKGRLKEKVRQLAEYSHSAGRWLLRPAAAAIAAAAVAAADAAAAAAGSPAAAAAAPAARAAEPAVERMAEQMAAAAAAARQQGEQQQQQQPAKKQRTESGAQATQHQQQPGQGSAQRKQPPPSANIARFFPQQAQAQGQGQADLWASPSPGPAAAAAAAGGGRSARPLGSSGPSTAPSATPRLGLAPGQQQHTPIPFSISHLDNTASAGPGERQQQRQQAQRQAGQEAAGGEAMDVDDAEAEPRCQVTA
jgi:hypothetical protein